MDTIQLADNLYVCGQISEADLETFAEEQFETIINNRPDHEEPGQIETATLRKKAESLGMNYFDLPSTPATIGPAMAEEFKGMVSGKTLAFCRTGNRSGIIYNLSTQL